MVHFKLVAGWAWWCRLLFRIWKQNATSERGIVLSIASVSLEQGLQPSTPRAASGEVGAEMGSFLQDAFQKEGCAFGSVLAKGAEPLQALRGAAAGENGPLAQPACS